MAVTISGFIIGRSLIILTAERSGRLHLDRPMTVIVPMIVERMVARIAMTNVIQIAFMVVDEANIFSYQRREKPEKWVSERDELNEKTTVYTIGI